MSASVFNDQPFVVDSPDVTYSENEILSNYTYQTTLVEGGKVKPVSQTLTFRTQRKVPRVGVMLVGLGGNNGSTVTAGILANKHGITWSTKDGEKSPNYWGSVCMASTVRLGNDAEGNGVYIPFHNLLPMCKPNDMVIGGWDISSTNMADAMERASVLDYTLQQRLRPLMKDMVPLPSIYFPDFIAANQSERADNVLKGTKQQQMDKIRQDIREFKAANGLEKVVVLWTANTERFSAVATGINDTAETLLASISRGEAEVSPSTIFACASILEGSTYINGSPQVNDRPA
ncbi:unnamed protein product [Discosporangium mesarthrocarpum]